MVLMSVPSPAYADDEIWQAPRSEPSNPAFFLRRGQTQSDSSDEYRYQSGDAYNHVGALDRSFNVSEQTLIQRFTYGITPLLEIYLQGSAVLTDKIQSKFVDGTTSSNNSSGFEDPVLGVLYRAMTQDRFYINLDLGADYAPNLVSALLPSPAQDGSVALGGQEAAITIAASRIWDEFTLKATLAATYLGTRREQSAALSSNEYIQPSWHYDARLLAYEHLTQNISIIAGIDYVIAENLNLTTVRGLPETEKPGNYSNITLGINYDISPRLSLLLQDQIIFLADSYYRFSTVSTDNSFIKYAGQNVVTLKLTVVF
jgi:hypothetical protein